MRLRDYLREVGETQLDFAARSGVPQPTVSDVVRGKGEPRASTIVKIERATGGRVRAEDMTQPSRMESVPLEGTG